jgi:hypothetical protein
MPAANSSSCGLPGSTLSMTIRKVKVTVRAPSSSCPISLSIVPRADPCVRTKGTSRFG